MLHSAVNVEPYSEFSPMLSDGPGKLVTPMTIPKRCVEGVGQSAHRRIAQIFCREIDPSDVSRIETWFFAEKGVKGSVVYSRLVARRPVLYVPFAYLGSPEERCLSGDLFDKCEVPRQMWQDAESAVPSDAAWHLLVHTREQDAGGALQPQSLDEEWRCALFSHS